MGMSQYRNHLIETNNSLDKAEHKTFTGLLNLADNGEYRHILEAFDVGDVYEFNIRHFEKSNDQNLQRLVYLYKEIAKIKNQLVNLNSIKGVELGFKINDHNAE